MNDPAYARQVNFMCHYATDDELVWMSEHGRFVPSDGQVVMLGAGPGVLLLALKTYAPDLIAHVIDIQRVEYVQKYLNDMGCPQNVTYEIEDSVKAGQRWRGKKIDLLIVDTDHTEATTRGEISTWLPHVVPSGVVFFHDYSAKGTWFEDQEQYPGVKVAVDDLMVNYILIKRVGTAAIFRKLKKR